MSYSKRQGGNYEGRLGHGKGFKRCPVEVGDELEVNITDISPSGDGMTRIQGYVIHVPNAKPRDRVKIKITQIGEKAANAEIVK
jgi:predicted RNA-binding protein with TRAM domain